MKEQSARSAPGDTSRTFGFRDVDASERQGLVNQVFADVAERYDLMNDLMSGGLHRLWKDDFVTWLNPPTGATPYRVLDLAGGTGDVALRIAGAGGRGVEVVICDISPEMLEVGQRKVEKSGVADRVTLKEGNAEQLPFEKGTFDAVTIA
ncbi:MAG: class I SAM-dependent methyltransferase, partial [Hyphomicrobiaceae bacterium]